MSTYTIKIRRPGVIRRWQKYKDLIGHNYFKDQNKMCLYFSNGSVLEVSSWSKCEMFLDTDWVLWTKRNMEKESGQSINLNVDPEDK